MTQKEKDKKLPQKLLKENEIDRMIKATKNPRDPALIVVLWKIGAKPGELPAMRLQISKNYERRNNRKLTDKLFVIREPECSSCGYLARESDNFCLECGGKIRKKDGWNIYHFIE